MVEGACDIAEMITNLVEEDNDDLLFSVGDEIGGLSNPLNVSGDVLPVSGWVASVGLGRDQYWSYIALDSLLSLSLL